jgi:transposase
MKYQLRRDRVRLHNQLESLLEEAYIKLSSLVSDLHGVSARGMQEALAGTEKPIRQLWPIRGCGPRRNNCVMAYF